MPGPLPRDCSQMCRALNLPGGPSAHAVASLPRRTRAYVTKPAVPRSCCRLTGSARCLPPSRSPSSGREGRLGNQPGRASGRTGSAPPGGAYLPRRRRRSRGRQQGDAGARSAFRRQVALGSQLPSTAQDADWTHLCVGNWTSPPDHSPVRLASARRPSARKADSTATACSGRPDRHEGISSHAQGGRGAVQLARRRGRGT
jgi:hypothetical protein